MPGSVPDAGDKVLGKDGVPASMAFHPLKDPAVNKAWMCDGHVARDTGPVCCQGSRNFCGVKDNSREGSGR